MTSSTTDFQGSKLSLQSGISTNEGKLILDNHKLSYHYERVQAWEAGEKVAVSVDMALTRSCGAIKQELLCNGQELQERRAKHDSLNFDDFKNRVKGVLISDGVSPAYVPFIEHAGNIGIDIKCNQCPIGDQKINVCYHICHG